MEHRHDAKDRLATPPDCGVFVWHGLLVSLIGAPLLGLVGAWLADEVQPHFAPIGLFPLLLGAIVGLSIVGLVRIVHLGHRPTILAAVVAAVAVAVVGQHVLGYLNAYYWASPPVGTGAATSQDLAKLAQVIRPSFGEYLAAVARHGRPLLMGFVVSGWQVWLSWGIDGLFVLAGALAVTIPALRVPYCNRCRTWYRTVRGGKIDHRTALRLAELVGVDAVEPSRSPRYRLSACEGGCSPTRCELSWEDVDGAVSLARVWLKPAERNEMNAILDGLEGEHLEA